MSSLRDLLAPVLVVSLALALTGCNSAPPGRARGRLPGGESTVSAAEDPRPLPSTLLAATDGAAQGMVTDLNRLAAEDFQGKRVGIAFGDIANRSQGQLSSNELELVRRRILNKLSQSKTFRDNVAFFSTRSRMEDFWKKEGARSTQEQLGGQHPQATISTQRGLPDYFYALNCDVDAIIRGPETFYMFTFTLMRASDGEEVWTNSYEQGKVVP